MAEATEEQVSELWRSPAVHSPSMDQLKHLSDSLKLQCSDQELAGIKKYIDQDMLPCYQKVDELVAPSIPVKYPRIPGHRPDESMNKLNAWYWKCDIVGAAEGKLKGKRVAIKDSICVAGVPMMNGTRLLEGFVPDIDATVVTRILDAGGHICGKTNCENLCLSGGSITNDTGPTMNPHNHLHSAGGSSSGSAVVVSTGEVEMALGGDQAGSVRIPASFCGIVGLKPTWGLVPYTGAIPIEMTIDHLGPIAGTVRDCALLLEVIAGSDNKLDPRQPDKLVVPEYTKLLENDDLTGKRIGVVKQGYEGCDGDVIDYVKRATECMAGAGAIVEDVSIPLHSDGAAIWTPMCLEGSYQCMVRGNGNSYHWKGFYPLCYQEALNRGFTTRPHDCSEPMKLFCLLGEHIAQNYQNKYYAKSQNLNLLLKEAYDKALANYDVLVMPTLPYKAERLPGKDSNTYDRLKDCLKMIKNTAPFDATGHPALTISVGKSEGLPVGMMIIGRHFDETSVLRVAHGYESLRDKRQKF